MGFLFLYRGTVFWFRVRFEGVLIVFVLVPSFGETDFPREEIREFIEKQGYDYTVALADRVKAYVRTWEEIHPETREWLERKSDWWAPQTFFRRLMRS